MKYLKLISKIFIFILLFSITIKTGLSAETLVYSEDFIFSDAYANHGFTYGAGGCGGGSEINVPVTSRFDSNYAFGLVDKSDCAFSYTRYISKNINTNHTNGTITFYANFSIFNDSTNLNTPIIISLRAGNVLLNKIDFYVTNETKSYSVCGNQAGCKTCEINYSFPHHNYSMIRVDLNLDSQTYDFYVNGRQGNCSNIDLNSDNSFYFHALALAQGLDSSEWFDAQIDNIRIYAESSTIDVFGTYQPCDNASQCLSGKCQRGFCVLKSTLESCSFDSQCLSGECVNSKCTKFTTWQGVDNAKDEFLGDDTETSDFISLTIMIFTAGAIAWLGGSIIAVVMAFAVFVVMGIFFAIVGWLSLFILFGIILVSLIFIVFAFIIGLSPD